MFLCTFAGLVLGGHLLQRMKMIPGKPIIARAAAPADGRWRVAYSHGGVDADLLYHDIGSAARPIKDAQVLFLGNSRVMFALKHEVLKPHFARMGMSYYVAAFPYAEQNAFAEALIRKHDLRPKWVLVNADPFFSGNRSGAAARAMREEPFDAWKLTMETSAAFEARRALHQWIPYFEPLGRKRDWILMRNLDDGTTHVAAMRADKALVRPATIASLRRFAITDENVKIARRFKKEIEARGGRLMLTTIPPRPPFMAWELGRRIGVPVVLPEVPKLMTCDGSHLDVRSARHYSKALLEQFEDVIAGRSNPIPTTPATMPRPATKAAPKVVDPDADDEF